MKLNTSWKFNRCANGIQECWKYVGKDTGEGAATGIRNLYVEN